MITTTHNVRPELSIHTASELYKVQIAPSPRDATVTEADATSAHVVSYAASAGDDDSDPIAYVATSVGSVMQIAGVS